MASLAFELTKGIFVNLMAVDAYSSKIFSLLSSIMQLIPLDALYPDSISIELKSTDMPMDKAANTLFGIESLDKNKYECTLLVSEDNLSIALQLTFLSLLIFRSVQKKDGLLIHGALAEFNGQGAILAGHGGAGKTTASRRLNPPWKSLCDDTTLIVKDESGEFRAHPWPTWSTFMFGDSGKRWDTRHSVPLKGIFFLSKRTYDSVEYLGPGTSVGLLQQSVEQATRLLYENLSEPDRRSFWLKEFDSICRMVKCVPSHKLYVSLEGSFWEKIEETLFAKQEMARLKML